MHSEMHPVWQNPIQIEEAAKLPSLLWLRLVGQESSTHFVLIGHSHGKLSRFVAQSVQVKNEVRRDDMRRVI